MSSKLIFQGDVDTKRVCQQRARNANTPRVAMGDDGNWVAVMPLPRLSWEDVQNVMLDRGGKCHWCDAVVWLTGTLDHIKPVGRGGTNERSNLTWACGPCNSKGYWRE